MLSKEQAEYIADIRLRNINREYIAQRVTEIETLQSEIAEIDGILHDDQRLKSLIAEQLREVKKKYGKPRKTFLIDVDEVAKVDDDDLFEENYEARFVMTRDGYFKKITLQSLRGSDEQKLKEGDEILFSEDLDNKCDLIFFTNKAQLYRARAADFEPVKASALGDFLPSKLNMEEDERPILMKALSEFNPDHHVVFVFENGKAVRIAMSQYAVKSNRRRQTAVFSGASPVVAGVYVTEERPLLLIDSQRRKLLVSTEDIVLRSTRTSTGNTLMLLKPQQKVVAVEFNFNDKPATAYARCKKSTLPALGVQTRDE